MKNVVSNEPQTPDAAFEKLFRDEHARCVRVARRIVGNKALAHEIAAEALTRAWSRWDALGGQRPGAWVVTVSTNLAIDAVRRRTPAAIDRPALIDSPEEGVVLRAALSKALRTLSSQQRNAILLRFVSELSIDEIASALCVSPGTVKTHLHRGIRRLRHLLGGESDVNQSAS
jgi:RNA polymerase sigma factor (sigma-70 family)